MAASRFVRTEFIDPLVPPFTYAQQVREQSALGTYQVRPDGTGTMTLTWSPLAVFVRPSGGQWEIGLETEDVFFVLAQGGRTMRYGLSLTAVLAYPPSNTEYRSSIALDGSAERQDDPCPAARFPPLGTRPTLRSP